MFDNWPQSQKEDDAAAAAVNFNFFFFLLPFSVLHRDFGLEESIDSISEPFEERGRWKEKKKEGQN